MEVEIVARPITWVVGFHYRGTTANDELPALWRKFWPRHREIKERMEPVLSFGVIDNQDPETKTMDYWAGIEVKQEARVPKGMAKICIPAQIYALVQCTLPALMRTIGEFYEEWLPNSVYDRGDGPEFELYDDRFDIGLEKFDMSVWIPVVEREQPVAGG